MYLFTSQRLLSYIFKNKTIIVRLAKWWKVISDFKFKARYKSYSLNHAISLSRLVVITTFLLFTPVPKYEFSKHTLETLGGKCTEDPVLGIFYKVFLLYRLILKIIVYIWEHHFVKHDFKFIASSNQYQFPLLIPRLLMFEKNKNNFL